MEFQFPELVAEPVAAGSASAQLVLAQFVIVRVVVDPLHAVRSVVAGRSL